MNSNTISGQHADLIRHVDWLISVDARRRVIRDATIVVKAGRFATVGKSAEIGPAWSAGKVMGVRGMVMTSGLVDNHLHSSFQMPRGLADEANAQSFLFDHIYPYEAAMTEEHVYASASLAAVELHLLHGCRQLPARRLTQVDQDLIMKEVRKTADRIAGRLNMNKILKLRWPVE